MSDNCQHGGPPAKPPGCSCSGKAEPGATGCPVCGRRPRAKSVPILDKRSFDFSNLGGGTEVYVVLCPALCVLGFSRVRLSVRVHALNMASGQSLRVIVWNTLPSDEDPAQDFVDQYSLTSAEITSSTTVPSLLTDRSSYEPDAYLKISLQATQTSAPTAFTATLSAALLLRTD